MAQDLRLKKAQELINSNETSKAMKLCREVIGIDSENAEAWHVLGSACHRNGNLEKARKYLDHAVKLQPEDLQLRTNYGLILAQGGLYEDALTIFDSILDQESQYKIAYEGLGRTLMNWAKDFDIQGWFTYNEAAQLYRLIRACKNEAPVIVELGSCYGLSSMIIARALYERIDSKIYCVDAWQEDGSSVDGLTREGVRGLKSKDLSFFQLFQNLMLRADVLDRLTPIKGYTDKVAQSWTELADVIFVDANHSYEGVKADIKDWKDFVKPNGLLIMHDVELVGAGAKEDSGPGRVVLEDLGKGSGFQSGRLVDTLYSIVRSPLAS